MTGVSRGANMAIASQFGWAKYQTVADCGTAQGDLIVQVALKNPHLAGTGFDLPEVAENFIHRVGRTGRAGKHGVASTLFSREQRSELFQLERTLGIKMERFSAETGAPAPAAEHTGRQREFPNHQRHAPYVPSASGNEFAKSRMVRLPGEVFQIEAD